MEDTSGFYKNDNGTLLFGPNFVENRDYSLTRDTHLEKEYPIDGWHWFESEEEARVALGVPVIQVEE